MISRIGGTLMATQRWNIDPSHSAAQFTVRHLVISKVRGQFERWQGTIHFDPSQPEASTVSVRIDAASIDTHEPNRDQHLRSADFFDVVKYPEITFESRKVERRGTDRYRVVGDLTMHGVTRSVDLDAEYLGAGKDPWGHQRIGFFAKTSINRKDFGLNWNQVLESGGVVVSEQVEISLDVQAIDAQAIGQAA
jgi:polyisoprenoid-binding protein YceI